MKQYTHPWMTSIMTHEENADLPIMQDGYLAISEYLHNHISTCPPVSPNLKIQQAKDGKAKPAAKKTVQQPQEPEKWAFMTVLDPASSLANLIYIGYAGDPASAFHITRKRWLDRKRQQSQRNVFQCFVFGPKNAGKFVLLNSLIGKAFSEKYVPITNERFATNIVELPGVPDMQFFCH